MHCDKDQLLRFWETMHTIRYFEESVEKNFLSGNIPGFVHLSIGEEAAAAGVCAALRSDDYIAGTHRSHGQTIAKGADPGRMMAEIYGKRDGLCKGKGGSMHIADFSIGMLGANGVVGGGFNITMGAALASKMQGKDRVAAVFFGDGASNRGTFHEAANLAAVWNLPVIFVCIMNHWASTTPYRTATSVEDISDRAAGYGMDREIADGNDVLAVYEAAKRVVEKARSESRPVFLELKSYRIKGHFVGDPEKYRTKEEVQRVFAATDPIARHGKYILENGVAEQSELDALQQRAFETIEAAVAFANSSAYPDESELYEDLYC